MTPSDDLGPGRPGGHVAEELAALVGGELELDETRAVTGHLRTCADCRQDLVEVTAGIALMRRLDALDRLPADTAEPPTAVPPTVDARTRRSRPRATLLIAAAVALVFAGVVSTTALLADRSDERPEATVVLAPVSDPSARGVVAMRASGSAQAMEVDTSLGEAPVHWYYEVWLLDSDTGKMLPVGVLPPDGHATYRLPGNLLESYDSVDISLQPDDGSTQHSSDSILRADYA